MIVSEHTLIDSPKNTVHSHIVGQLSQARYRSQFGLISLTALILLKYSQRGLMTFFIVTPPILTILDTYCIPTSANHL